VFLIGARTLCASIVNRELRREQSPRYAKDDRSDNCNNDCSQIVNHLPKLYTDLQKFAVVFEELVEDESNPQKQIVLRGTQSYLMRMLCEVESTIVVLPSLQLPQPVEMNIMSSIERNPVDDTRRLIRDWGVLLKYRDYLLAWKDVFKYEI